MSVQLREVNTKKDLKKFINFSYQLYKNNPYWVPPLKSGEMTSLTDANPAYDHCSSKRWVAIQNGKIVGRINVAINHRETEILGEKHGRFGWFDFIDDLAVSQSLLQVAENWALEQQCQLFKGPFGFTNMDRTGLLTEGFDELVTMATMYNFPYYPKHYEAYGLETLLNWKEFEATVPTSIPEKVTKFSELIKKRYQVKELVINKSNYVKLGTQVFQLVNAAYAHLDGYIPHTEKQIAHYVDQYFKFIDPDYLAIIGNADNEVVAIGISMPSFSKALQKSHGKLFPTGFLHLQRAMKTNERADLYLIAVRPDLQNKGITAIIFEKLIRTFINRDIQKVETNPELEDNHDVQNLWKGYEMRLHKRRKCYAKQLTL